jgi:hypothetical protein
LCGQTVGSVTLLSKRGPRGSAERGIEPARRLPEVQPLAPAEAVDLMEAHDQVWHW